MDIEKQIGIVISVIGLVTTIFGVFKFSALRSRVKTLEEVNNKLLELLKEKE